MNFIKELLNFPKTIYVNFKCLKFKDALKLPIKVNRKIKIEKLEKNSIEINGNISKSMIKIGFSGAGFVSENKSYLHIENGKIIFNGTNTFAEGINIYIKNGICCFGNNIYANKNFQIQCEKNIKIDDDSLIGWNVSIRDTDGHKVIKDGKIEDCDGNIIIGKHVWIASNSIILKNSNITDGSIIGCNSLVCGINMNEKNSLIAGIPAKIKRNDIDWIR